jgi:hypothetical protein
MLSSSEQTPVKSPVVPLTAGPDLGRHNNARLDIVGYSQVSMLRLCGTYFNPRSLVSNVSTGRVPRRPTPDTLSMERM